MPRHRLLAAVTVASIAMAGLVATAPDALAAGTPSLTDAYTDAARYAAVTVSAVVHETSGTDHGGYTGSGFVDNFASTDSGGRSRLTRQPRRRTTSCCATATAVPI